MRKRKKQYRNPCPPVCGSDHPNAKLTEEIVEDLRKIRKLEGRTFGLSVYARALGVTPPTLWFAVHPHDKRGTWRHVK